MVNPLAVPHIRFARDLAMARHLKQEADELAATIREDMATAGATSLKKVTLFGSYEYLARRTAERLYHPRGQTNP